MIKIKIFLDRDSYHATDKLSDSVDESGKQKNSTCGGYDNFCKTYPEFRGWLLANPPSKEVDEPQETFYIRFIKEKNGEDALTATIHPIEIEKLGAIMLAKAEIRFQTVALLAQKGLRTGEEEQKLLHLKEAIILLSKYKTSCVAVVPQVQKMTENTQFGTLRKLPENVSNYVETLDGNIIGCIPVPHHQNEKLYILVPAVEDAAPPLKLGFDGKNFIAVYTENMPKLPESTMKILSLPEAKQ